MIKLFNTLTRTKDEIKPQNPPQLTMYVCGPTVYDSDHLGHARTFVIFDMMRRWFEHSGFKVKFVQNITDVGHLTGDADEGEDKILKKAKLESKDPYEIARFFERAHFDDMAALNVLPPDASPRATDQIPEIIKIVEGLIQKGHAYEANGSVYFDVASFPNYGKLSNRNIDELLAGARVEENPEKKNPADFALWKKAEANHIMQWDSPWGKGFPGWHIECSAMNEKFLGPTIDIHGGAVELAFPHHENEIAQSESMFEAPLANYWLHSGLVTIKGEKMSKSLGNFTTIKDILTKYDPDAVRLWVLKTHWRRPLDYDEGSLEEAAILANKLARNRLKAPKKDTPYIEEITEALNDDFNTPKALTVILSNIEKLSQKDFAFLEEVFGLKMGEIEVDEAQFALIQKREKLRKEGKFEEADAIRAQLLKENILLEDTATGTKALKAP